VTNGSRIDPADRPLDDIVAEARRILARASAGSVPLRLIGGVAIHLHSSVPRQGLARRFKDIDLVTPRTRGRELTSFIASLGYAADDPFNAMNAGRRALYYDTRRERQLDVFVGSFEMCHVVPIADRFEIEPETLPLAELLLTKLQVVELNEKDMRDIMALLVEHELGDHDADTINAAFVAKLCAEDWGLWRTCTMNIERSRVGLESFNLSSDDRRVLADRLESLLSRIEAAPKSRRWKLRARIGDKVRWYEEPDEVG
jgi:hypothetical protein